MDETLIVIYSKYKAYQRKICARQIERAERIITIPGHKSQNDPMRCVKKLPLLLMVRLQDFSISLLQLHKEEFISCSVFSILSMRYPIPICVWMYCVPFFSGSSFFRSVAIKTLREATSFSEHRPQICWVI